MGKHNQTPLYADADRTEPMAKRIAALQERARQHGFEQTHAAIELKAFMDDQWGESETGDR